MFTDIYNRVVLTVIAAALIAILWRGVPVRGVHLSDVCGQYAGSACYVRIAK